MTEVRTGKGCVLRVAIGLLLLGVAVLAGVSMVSFAYCAGQMSACYQAWKMPDAMKRTRLAALSQFAASAQAIAFRVILDNDEHGLAFIERGTGQARLIYEKDKAFLQPHFSIDGKRLFLIQRHIGLAKKEIISCSTDTWRCMVLLQTEDDLRSPIEIEDGTLIYAASPLFVSSEDRHLYMDWDFYLLKKGATPVRLSNLRLQEVLDVSVVNDKLIFSGWGQVLSRQPGLARDLSKIYAVELDRQSQSIKPSGEFAKYYKIEPIFMLGGYSSRASVSRDGRHAAVLNTKTDKFKYRWDIVLATSDGTVQRRIELSGLGFSRGEFIGETLLFNELFEDWYDVQLLDLTNNKLLNILRVEHAPEKIRSLELIRLVVENAS